MPVCQHCDHEWDYSGEKDAGMYTNCPSCYYKVQLPE